MRELTYAERMACVSMIAKHGNAWKRVVRALWERGVATTDTEATLYALRNAEGFGPSWLERATTKTFLLKQNAA